MKRLAFVALLLVSTVALAQATDVWLPSGFQATDACLHSRDDGGVHVEAWGLKTSADAGNVDPVQWVAGNGQATPIKPATATAIRNFIDNQATAILIRGDRRASDGGTP